jgi:phosphopantothenate synthetase
MARVMKLREASEPSFEVEQAVSQHKRPEAGRYLLQVDRQTKGSYETAEAAHAAGLAIKTGHPIVRVSVYDAVECKNELVELGAPS